MLITQDFEKKHNNENDQNPTDMTSFHPQLKSYGKDRDTRSPLLFQIHAANAYKQEPTGFMMNKGRVVLDQWNHGVRDFPELPEVISTAIEGHDIEDLMRRNMAIRTYDLMARMVSSILSIFSCLITALY